MLHKFICYALSFLLLSTNVAFSAQATIAAVPQHDSESIASHLESVFRRLDRLSSMVDRTQFDPDALLDSLDYEGEQLIQYVKREIHFQAYEGVLRGPEGTLISRSGNALDQSLLLAKLLKDAGYEARIVRGKLPPDEARTLLRGMAKDVIWPSAFRTPGELESLVRRFLPKLPSDPDLFRMEMNKITEQANSVSVENADKVETVHKALQNVLSEIYTHANSSDFEEKLISELEDYFWVEYKLDSSTGWQSAHPSFPESNPPELQIIESFKDQIPAELQHRIRFQVFVETILGNTNTVTPLMSSWERPAANAAFKPQTLMIMPHTNFEVNGKLDLAAGLEKVKFLALQENLWVKI